MGRFIQWLDTLDPSVPGTSLTCSMVADGSRRQTHSLAAWARTALAPLGMKPARHQTLLLQNLMDVAEGRCDRLMVLMPPGSAKSTYCSLLFPAWWLHKHPAHSILAASHTVVTGG